MLLNLVAKMKFYSAFCIIKWLRMAILLWIYAKFHLIWIVQYIPRNVHTVFALLCFVVVIHWLIFPYPSGLLHWHCGNLTIAPVPAKQPWWIWINASCEFIMNDCITTTKQSTTKPCTYFLGYTVSCSWSNFIISLLKLVAEKNATTFVICQASTKRNASWLQWLLWHFLIGPRLIWCYAAAVQISCCFIPIKGN